MARRPSLPPLSTVAALAVAALLGTAVGSAPASAAEPPVGLGTAASFAVLAGSTVTNTGPTTVRGDVGVHPGTAVTGFPPGVVTDGTIHSADAVASQAKADLVTAYDDAASRPSTAAASSLGGLTLVGGVYSGPTLDLTGTLTLDAQGDPSTVFVFQSGSTLITASGSRVLLVNGASPCNVFWQVGSSATLGTGTDFVGTVLALTSITADTGADVAGRLLARNGATTLASNDISRFCAAAAPSTAPTATATATASAAPSSAPPSPTTTPVPTASPTASPDPTGAAPTATPTGATAAPTTSSSPGPTATSAPSGPPVPDPAAAPPVDAAPLPPASPPFGPFPGEGLGAPAPAPGLPVGTADERNATAGGALPLTGASDVAALGLLALLSLGLGSLLVAVTAADRGRHAA